MSVKGFWKKYKLFIVYNLFGFTATVLETVLYWLFYRKAAIGNVPATLASWIITVIYAFFTNKLFVYRSIDWMPSHVVGEFSSFFGFRAATGLYNILHMWVTVDICHLWPVTMKVISALIVGLMNYFAGKSVVFKRGMEMEESQSQYPEIDNAAEEK